MTASNSNEALIAMAEIKGFCRLVTACAFLFFAALDVAADPKERVVDPQRFLNEFIAALQQRDSNKAAQLVQQNLDTARVVQKRLGERAIRAPEGEQADTLRSLARLLNDLIQAAGRGLADLPPSDFKDCAAQLPDNEMKLLDNMIRAVNARDFDRLAKVVWNDPTGAAKMRKFLLEYSHEAGANQAGFRQLAQMVADLLESSGRASIEGFVRGTPSLKPFLRLDPGVHTSWITAVDITRSRDVLVSASIDKTVRLWELPSGRLLRTFRLPIGDEAEGEVRAVAITPDGSLVAAGGNTGVRWDRDFSVYIFDVETGAIAKRLTDLSSPVAHLAFSTSGGRLAIALANKGGVRVYRTSDWSLEFEDPGFPASWANFAPSGRLVVVSRGDGLRLYDSQLRLSVLRRLPGGGQPVSAVFSPNGENVAVGHQGISRLDIVDGTTLVPIYSPDLSGVDNGDLSSVAWSEDGNELFAGGLFYAKQTGSRVVRHWSHAGRGRYNDIIINSSHTISTLTPSKGNGVIFTTTAPSIGALDRGEKIALPDIASVKADFRAIGEGFLVSGDGSAIRFGLDYGGERPRYFAVLKRIMVKSSAFSSGFEPPIFPTLELRDLFIFLTSQSGSTGKTPN